VSKPNLRGIRSWGLRDVRFVEDKILSTNSKGLRSTTEYSYGKNTKKKRILILGDSFTFGDEVSDNETYSYFLQQMMPNTEIINGGVSGYGFDQMLIFLREELVKYKPDIVILGFIENDMERCLLQFRDYAKPKFIIANGKLELRGVPVPRPENFLKWDWARPKVLDVLSTMRYKFRILTGKQRRAIENITIHILREIVRVTNNIPAQAIFVYLPYGREISTDNDKTYGEKFLSSFCATTDGVQYLSTRPEFAMRIAAGAEFKRIGHWGPEGHLTVAKAIRRFLVDEEL
jgi:lysophospholipase L1-like esterase